LDYGTLSLKGDYRRPHIERRYMKQENAVTRARAELHKEIIYDLKLGIDTFEAISLKHGMTMRTIFKIAKENHLRRKDGYSTEALSKKDKELAERIRNLTPEQWKALAIEDMRVQAQEQGLTINVAASEGNDDQR
jgi:hypothetical protein